MEWWTGHDTYAVSVWFWMLFILWGAAKILSWTVFAPPKKKKEPFYEAVSNKPRRAPLIRAFFGEKARRASDNQHDWEKV